MSEHTHTRSLGFSDSSVGKESTCNAGDPGSIPGPGRSAGERKDRLPTPVFFGFPCGSAGKEYSYSIGDLETWVWSLGWEAPLEKGKATYSSILAWRIPWTALSMGLQRVGHNWATFTTLYGRYQSIWFILFMILSIFIFLKLAECIFFFSFPIQFIIGSLHLIVSLLSEGRAVCRQMCSIHIVCSRV